MAEPLDCIILVYSLQIGSIVMRVSFNRGIVSVFFLSVLIAINGAHSVLVREIDQPILLSNGLIFMTKGYIRCVVSE